MGKKKRGHPDIEELLARPWCYYCERDFEDLKLLISHQKAKHYKCDRCGRRLNTAGGLNVHMNQVHKETLSNVENALANRQGLDVEVFGMEGIPEDVVQQHNQRIIQNFYQAQAERQAATGNAPNGQGSRPAKKVKMETPEDIKRRLAEHRAKVQVQRTAGNGAHAPLNGRSPAQSNSPFNAPPGGAPYDYQQQYGQPGYAQPPFPGAAAAPPGYPPTSLPGRPPSNAPPAPATSALPQRPSYGGANYWDGGGGGNASTVDELVAGAARGDDIDQIIRMAEAGIKPPRKDGAAAPAEEGEKKGKKEKGGAKMVYGDVDASPEDAILRDPRYASVAEN